MINLDCKNKCCACGACADKCPYQAISFQPDQFGNHYPIVDDSKCVKCGLCEKVCPFENIGDLNGNHTTYAVKLKNCEKLKNSASGGAFYGLAKGFLESDLEGKSKIYGCVFDENVFPKHIGVNLCSDLNLFQGSKYVRSEMRVYEDILTSLKNDQNVLFSGTPCQCRAVQLYCAGFEKQLYTIELICHGVIDQDYWKEYIESVSKRCKGKVVFFNFREKHKNKPFTCKYVIKKKNEKQKEYFENSALSYYYYHFLSGAVFRNNCYHCPFATDKRAADITIGDYWGYDGKLDATDGISALIINTLKGEELFNNSQNNFQVEKKTFADAARTNEQLKRPFSIEKKNYQILKEWKKYGSLYMHRQHIKKHWKAWIISKIIK